MTEEWVNTRGRGPGQFLLRLHRAMSECTHGDIWSNLARFRASFPQFVLSQATHETLTTPYVYESYITPQRYWRGLLPSNHPQYQRDSRRTASRRRRVSGASGRYVGMSCGEETDVDDEGQYQRRRVFSLLTEDERSDDEGREEALDAADWVLSAGELLKRVATTPLRDAIEPDHRISAHTSTSSSSSSSTSSLHLLHHLQHYNYYSIHNLSFFFVGDIKLLIPP